MGEDEFELSDLVPGVRSTLPTPTPFLPPANTALPPRNGRRRKPVEAVAQAAMARQFTTPEGRASIRRASGSTRKAHRMALLAVGKHPKPPGRAPKGATWDFGVGRWKLLDGSFIHDSKQRTRLNRAAHRRPKGIKRNRKPALKTENVTINVNLHIAVQAEYVAPADMCR